MLSRSVRDRMVASLFAKYYTFDPATGARLLAANLDGRGNKAMPSVCTACHGGRGDPLTPPDASGNQLFAIVGNPASGVRGDLKGKLHFFEPDSFSFLTLMPRVNQELAIKTLNQWVLCTYPLPTSTVVPTGYAGRCLPQRCHTRRMAGRSGRRGQGRLRRQRSAESGLCRYLCSRLVGSGGQLRFTSTWFSRHAACAISCAGSGSNPMRTFPPLRHFRLRLTVSGSI